MNGTAQEVGPASSVFEGTNSITSLTGPWNYMSKPIQWPGEFYIAGHTQKHYGHKVREKYFQILKGMLGWIEQDKSCKLEELNVLHPVRWHSLLTS